MADLLVALGAEIRRLREAQELTQQQLGLRIGLSRTSITNIEAGRQGDIGVTTLVKLADSLNTTVGALVAGTTETSAWLDLARRVTASERQHRQMADDCWKSHDVLAAVRLRGIADGLEMAREHHVSVVAGDGGESRG